MRTEIEKRPALLVLLGLIAGMAASTEPLRVLYAAVGIWVLRSPSARTTLVLAAILGYVMAPRWQPPLESAQPVSGSGTVVTMPKILEKGQRFVWQNGEGRFDVIALAPSPDLGLGDHVALDGVANPPTLESREYFVLNQLRGRITAQARLEKESSIFGVGMALNSRRGFIEWSDRQLPESSAHLLQAMCFGADSLLTPTQWSQLRDSGTIHIVSASGFQVSVLCAALFVGLSVLPIPRLWVVAMLGLALWIYALAAGFNAPIIRAFLMAIVPQFAFLCRRVPDYLSALALAGIVLIAHRPAVVFDPGFQLSMTTVLALILFARVRNEGTDPLRSASQMVRVGVIATVSTLPILMVHFESAPLLSVFPNMLISLPSAACVVLGMGQFGLSQAGMVATEPISAWILEGLLSWCLWVVSIAASWQFSIVRIPQFPPDLAAGVLILIFMNWRFTRVAVD